MRKGRAAGRPRLLRWRQEARRERRRRRRQEQDEDRPARNGRKTRRGRRRVRRSSWTRGAAAVCKSDPSGLSASGQAGNVAMAWEHLDVLSLGLSQPGTPLSAVPCSTRTRRTLKGHTGICHQRGDKSATEHVSSAAVTDKTTRSCGTRLTGKAIACPQGARIDRVASVAISSDGTRHCQREPTIPSTPVAPVSLKVMRTRRQPTESLTLKSRNGMVNCVAISGDGTRIVSTRMDNTVIVWEARTGK